MTTDTPVTTAQIIQFPARGRFSNSTQHRQTSAATELRSENVFGEAWYHEAAIRESVRANER